jgi:uncharacterized protein (TIGR02147 family)
MTLQTPNILKFFTAKAYLEAFFDLNKSKVRGFSHRSFAAKIDWPVSYLSDVFADRKKFTVIRAVQFAQYVSLNSLETERLIYMALCEESDSSVQSYAQTRIIEKASDEKRESTADYEFFTNVDFEAVMATLIWAGKKLSPKEIKSLLYTFPHLTEKRIKEGIDFLIAKSLIQFDEQGKVTSYCKDLVLDEQSSDSPNDTGVRIHEQYADSFMNFTRAAQAPCMYNAGFFEIPRSEFMAIARKFLELRNWLADYVESTREKGKGRTTDTLVFQLDLNLFTIFDKDSVKSHEVTAPVEVTKFAENV